LISGSRESTDGSQLAISLNQYVGTHHNDYFGHAMVAVVRKAMQLSIGPIDGGLTWSLTHWVGDVFKLRPGTMDTSYTAVSAIIFVLFEPKETFAHEYYGDTSRGIGILTRVDLGLS
jgi:hypothetical protein